MTLASDHQFPKHDHDQFGIGVIRVGAQRSWSGIGQVEAGPGEVIMVNPGETHDGVPIHGQIREWRMIYFEPKFLAQELVDELTGSLEIVSPVAQDPLLAQHFDRLFTSLTNCKDDSAAREEKLLLLLVRAAQRHSIAGSPQDVKAPCVRRVLKRLDVAPEIPFSLRDLAASAGLSRFQLLRAFTLATGTTPHAFLLQRRVRLAKQLLGRGDTPVQAALKAGFADQSHMTRAFVRQFGITPGRYQAAVV